MLLQALVLTAAINIELDLTGLTKALQREESTVSCGIRTVGYRFIGTPGQTFRYAGEQFTIPAEGWGELIAERRTTTYAFDGRSIPLGDAALDPFGFRDVALPGNSMR